MEARWRWRSLRAEALAPVAAGIALRPCGEPAAMPPFRYSAPLRIAREEGITGDCVGSVHGTTHQAPRHGVGCLGSGLQREKSAVKGGVSATWSGASAPDEIN